MNKYHKGFFFPEGLKAGDSVGIIAPGGKVDAEKIHKGCKILKEKGFNPVLPESVYEQDGYFAGTDSIRAASLMKMFMEPDIKAVICARGGYGSMRIAGLVDYDIVAANPKIFMGFSDVTLLLSEITRKCGFITWHGPMVSTIATSDVESTGALFDVLSGCFSGKTGSGDLVSISGSGTVEGIAVCGNLTTFCHTAGTQYQPDWNGCVVFLEDINEPLYRLDRMLLHMKLAGFFRGVIAVVLGDFTGCGCMSDINSLFEKELAETGVSLFSGFRCGHASANMPVPFGAGVRIDLSKGIIEWLC
jgi:muramoyltetrapeptide carboxypeptidase